MSDSVQYGFDDLPPFKKGPYTWIIRDRDWVGYAADIYYEGKYLETKKFERSFVLILGYWENNETSVSKTYNGEEAIDRTLQREVQRYGFYSLEEKKYYPSLRDLGIENPQPGDEKDVEGIDFTSILSFLGVKISDITLPPALTSAISNVNISGSSISGSIESSPSGSLGLPKPPEIPKKLKLIPIKGKIVDSTTNEPLKGVRVFSPLKKPTKTDKDGNFEVKVPEILNTPLDPKKFEINVSGKKGKYASTKITPYTSTNDVKLDLGIITLQPLESNLKQEITALLTFKDAEVEKYATVDLTFEFFQQKQLNISISELKKLVIPLVINMIAQYGLSKVQEMIAEVEANGGELTDNIKQQIVCPFQDALVKIISLKNKLVHQLNNVLNKINGVSQTLQISDDTVQTIDTIFQVLKVLPTPTAIGGVGIPISVINTVQDVKTFLNNNIGKIKQGSSALSTILGLLVDVLTQVISFLNFLDKITQFCSQGEINQEQISKELTTLTQQQSKQLSPVVTNVNGFEMGVETEKTTQPLKRRRAIARNKQGVVMLKGEWSFSSIDQILIDELVFYIQQNNLKAE
jgi:hypothetical protein